MINKDEKRKRKVVVGFFIHIFVYVCVCISFGILFILYENSDLNTVAQ